MNDFENRESKHGFSMKLWRGERMCLLGFDVKQPEPDFVGFAVEFKPPRSIFFYSLLNRLSFSYDKPTAEAVTGERMYRSTGSPFQTFRWIHFPRDVKSGGYTYRATKMHMPADGKLVKGESITLGISLDPVTYEDFLDIGFTRNFASSQAFAKRYKNVEKIMPSLAKKGLEFKKAKGDVYEWLGFEAYDLIFDFLKEVADDTGVTLDVLAYELNEPDIVALLEKLGPRLRIVIDDSADHKKADCAESKAAECLKKSAGDGKVKRTHFSGLQHQKVFIARRNGRPFKVLAGSTNFSFRGIYIQANNVLVFRSADVADYFGKVFDAYFENPRAFKKSTLAADWLVVSKARRPSVHLCFSPHRSADTSLVPVADAIEQAQSSVLYSVAFLGKIPGPAKKALEKLMTRPIFSYGTTNEAAGLSIKKPDGSVGLVDFGYLEKTAPKPFAAEWAGGQGIRIHHKFVVTDFNLPGAKVFTGSSNLAKGGEEGNGDQLIMIEDRKIAVAYAIEALRVFDHFHFRSRMKEAKEAKDKKAKITRITLRKPVAIGGGKAWFERFYVPNSQLERDRLLFSR
jgi:phosphatidylserine/phosphatidylglycerophosphate/cardiolipin synthase-like enzyme